MGSMSRVAARIGSGVALTLAANGLAVHAQPSPWAGYARDAQHHAGAPARTSPLDHILWSTPVDLHPHYSGNELFIHYGSPMITASNSVIVPVKVGSSDSFRFEARNARHGDLLWTLATDYSLPDHDWTPSCSGTITPQGALVVPAAGGTVLIKKDVDAPGSPVARVAFFGTSLYNANAGVFNPFVRICTPITADAVGNVYFGFRVSGTNPANLTSGLARIAPDGTGSWVSASAAASDPAMVQVQYNCAPALSRDGTKLYVAVHDSWEAGYLLCLDSTTLQMVARVRLKDPSTGGDAYIHDDSTASPTIGTDDEVYFGVLENPWGHNHDRGWLLHFNAALTQTLIPGAFGWDDTASLVPASAVPGYHGESTYLLFTKYNNYAGIGGDGINKIAVLDPRSWMIDPISGIPVMREVLTIAGVTPDSEFGGDAVREWCINSAVIDAEGKSALANSEDGVLYRWDFATNTLSEKVVLTPGIGEAYTPTISGPDGTVYAINNATLFAVGVCIADFNGDGFADVFDFTDFVGCFEGGSCPAGISADVNRDGFVDVFDFQLFVDAFEAGC